MFQSRRSSKGAGVGRPLGAGVATSLGGDDRPHQAGVEANARLTASTSVVLVVLLAIEGATVVSVRSLLSPHVFIGVLLVPPVVVKIVSTAYRFARYYRGDPAYRRKGPPPWVLRLLGPAVVLLTVILFASGIALLGAGARWHSGLLLVHKASFVVWFVVMAVHVLGHLGESLRLGIPDWAGRARGARGVNLRRGVLVASLLLGAAGGAALLGWVGPYLATFGAGG